MLTLVRASDKVPLNLEEARRFCNSQVSPAPSPAHLATMQHHETLGF
jgi:hypothetical protein